MLRQHLRHIYNVAAAIPVTLREYARLRRAWPSVKDNLPGGDGHPVLVLPGFLSSDLTTGPLRRRLAQKNYAVYGWGRGLNLGIGDKSAAHLRNRLADIFAAHGRKKVTIIGHSLGGLYARELAREYPDMVRDVITLGAPFNRENPFDAIAPTLAALYRAVNRHDPYTAPENLAGRGHAKLSVPATALFSRDDTMVDWKACLNPKLPRTDNIGVNTSHVGLVFSLSALAAMLGRLAWKENEAWRAFDTAAASLPYDAPPKEDELPASSPNAARAFRPLFRTGPD